MSILHSNIASHAGTKVPLTLTQGITTKTAKEGDPVYAQTAFPITQNNRIVIPAGTYVQGVVRRVVRPGRVKGRAELQMSFTSMIFPNGYTVLLPATVQGVPGSQNVNTKGSEGTIEGQGSKGKDAATIAKTTAAGAGIGAIAGSGKGAGIGAASGERTRTRDRSANSWTRDSVRSRFIGRDDIGTRAESGRRQAAAGITSLLAARMPAPNSIDQVFRPHQQESVQPVAPVFGNAARILAGLQCL